MKLGLLSKPRKVGETCGFTLLELLLALSLTVVLFGVLFTAIELHWRFSLSGQEEVTRSQIARSVFNRMSQDIRSTVYRAKPKTSSSDSSNPDDPDAGTSDTGTSSTGTSNGTGTGSSTGQSGANSGTGTQSSGQNQAAAAPSASSGSGSTTPTEPIPLTDAYSGPALGVFGDAESIVMHVMRPDRLSRGTADAGGAAYSASDLKSVAYYLSDSSSGLATMFGGASSSSQGLTRVSADRLTLSLAGSNVDLVTSATRNESLAPEIESMSFSYFDGAEWLSGWDSEVEGRLPNAIGISITFRAPNASDTSFVSKSASTMSGSFRIVVTLPSSNPFSGMTL